MNSCTWFDMPEATIRFCEEIICGSILTQPSNAISNIGFILVGIYLLKIVKGRSIYLLFPISSILVGITSFLYHASSTFFFQVFDVSSMFMLSCLLLSFNLWRLKMIKRKVLPLFYTLSLLLSSLLMILIKGQSGEIIFALEVIFVLILEFILYKRGEKINYKYFLYAFSTFLLSFIIWTLDVKEILCIKDNHIFQGHALWHLLNALCFYFLYQFYKEFNKDSDVSSSGKSMRASTP